MENASKALIMAGTILISIMVISLGVYIINMFGEYVKGQEQERINQQIAEFNAEFLKYEGRDDITAQDIVTVANLANANNKNYELTTADANNSNPEQQGSYYITVSVTSINNNFENGDKEQFLTDNSIIVVGGKEKIQHYTCTNVIMSDVTKYVSKITFIKNNIVDD